jgi:uncharacterized membrane protein YphA (DoxX/SURF4 family)
METAVIILATTGRILVGLVMLVAGIAKLKAGPQQFSRAILDYNLVSPSIAMLLGKWLPWLEVITGICLVAGIFTNFAAMVAFALLLVFSFAMTISLYHGRKHNCGCLGLAKAKQVRWQLVYRNLALMGVIVSAHTLQDRLVAAKSLTALTSVTTKDTPVLTALITMWLFSLCFTLVLYGLTRRKLNQL